MKRVILILCVALLAVLAGCSGGDAPAGESDEDQPAVDEDDSGNGDTSGGDSSDDGASTGDDSTNSGDGDSGDGTNSGDGDGAASDGDGGASSGDSGSDLPEIAMLQFDRTERYVYNNTYVDGVHGTTYVDVVVSGGEATINVTSLIGGDQRRLNDVYTVPTNNPDEVVDAMSDDIRRGGVFFILQSQDVTATFVEQELAWETGAEYSSFFGNITVTGEDTIGGVDCLTYEFEAEGTTLETGCITSDLEMPVSWTKYFGDGTVRSAWRLVSYEQG